jgi:hypothetical protein
MEQVVHCCCWYVNIGVAAFGFMQLIDSQDGIEEVK